THSAHNAEAAGSNPAPATNKNHPPLPFAAPPHKGERRTESPAPTRSVGAGHLNHHPLTRPPGTHKGPPATRRQCHQDEAKQCARRATQHRSAKTGPPGKRPPRRTQRRAAHNAAHHATDPRTKTRGGSQHGYRPNRHSKMVANQTTSNQTSNQQQHLQLPNMRRRTRLRIPTPTQQRRGRPHHPAQSRRRRLARKHTNHLPLVQPTQGQRDPTPQTDGAETARTTNRVSMVDSWCRTGTRVPRHNGVADPESQIGHHRSRTDTPGGDRSARLDLA